MITLSQARATLPAEEQGMSDAELSSLLASCYELARLAVDIWQARKGVMKS